MTGGNGGGSAIKHMQTQTLTKGETHTHTLRRGERKQNQTHPSGVVKANEGSALGWHSLPFHVVRRRGGGGGLGQAGEQ